MATPIPDNVVCFRADEILAATGGLGSFAGEVRGVCLDSRRVKEGNLFVALRGETHDAHEHVGQALAAGAAAALVERSAARTEDLDASALIEVDDTVRALGALAATHRARFSELDLVGVTGSVGKTTTKELLGAALRGIGREVHVTRGNLNNRVGVPMTLFGLDASHDAAVIEMGMNEPGEIADLARMSAPRVGLVTSVAEVHTEGVGSIEGVAREKGALLAALPVEGCAVWNVDDAPLAGHAQASPATQKIGFGRSEHAAMRVLEHSLDASGTRATFAWGEARFDVRLAMLGGHAAVNAAGALAVIAALDATRLDDAIGALASVAPTPHRMSPRAIGALLVIDDAYNASPRSMRAALDACAELARGRGGRVIAVLGDMLELGRREQELHAALGRDAIERGVKAVITCGERMTEAGRAALMATMNAPGPRAKVVILRNVEDAAGCVREVASANDVVLVKGSRGMRMERVVTALAEAGA